MSIFFKYFTLHIMCFFKSKCFLLEYHILCNNLFRWNVKNFPIGRLCYNCLVMKRFFVKHSLLGQQQPLCQLVLKFFYFLF